MWKQDLDSQHFKDQESSDRACLILRINVIVSRGEMLSSIVTNTHVTNVDSGLCFIRHCVLSVGVRKAGIFYLFGNRRILTFM